MPASISQQYFKYLLCKLYRPVVYHTIHRCWHSNWQDY